MDGLISTGGLQRLQIPLDLVTCKKQPGILKILGILGLPPEVYFGLRDWRSQLSNMTLHMTVGT